ncbi:MAG: signal peptide peptidase SppA [Elusimicrobia bacterium]|nr:signal peptide peptidase SppA [Elusimicrobiota bacterium]
MSEENTAQEAPQQQPQARPAADKSFLSCWRQASPAARLLSALFALSVLSAFWITFYTSAPRPPRAEDEEAAAQPLMRLNKDGIAWLPVKGVITYSDRWDKRGAEQLSKRIREMGEKKNVKAIVLDINSPGGSVGAVQDVYYTIKTVREQTKKPFIALFRDISASGGYYIASACDKIVAYPGTLTGSIGVIMQLTNVQGLTQKIGVKMETIKSGDFKDIGSMFREMRPEERQVLQDMVSDTYAQFYDAVKSGRGFTDEQLRPLADGRIFSGRQALKAGLVDGIGGRDQVLELASELAKLPKNPPIINEASDRWQDLLTMLDAKLGLHLPGLSNMLPSGPAYLWPY